MRSSSKPAVYTEMDTMTNVMRWAPDDLATMQPRRSPNGVGSAAPDDALTQSEADIEELRRAEQESRIQDAYTAGYDAGRREGERTERARLRHAISAAEQALDTIRSHEVTWQAAVEENIAALAVAVARQVIGREVSTDVTAVADLVKRALVEFPIDQPMRIRVHPLDLSMLSASATPDGAPVAIAPTRDIRWLADGRIQPGGCIVEGRERIIDGRVDTALERIYRQLAQVDA